MVVNSKWYTVSRGYSVSAIASVSARKLVPLVFTTLWFGKGGRPHYVNYCRPYYWKVSEASKM